MNDARDCELSPDADKRLDRAVEQLQATVPQVDMPGDVADRILTAIDHQRATAQESKSGATFGRTAAIAVSAAAMAFAAGMWVQARSAGPATVSPQERADAATADPGSASTQNRMADGDGAGVNAASQKVDAAATPAPDDQQSSSADEGQPPGRRPEEQAGDGQDGDQEPSWEQLNEMVEQGDPAAVPMLRRRLVAESEWLADEERSTSLIHAMNGLGRYGDRTVLKTIEEIYRPQQSTPQVREAAALAIARIGSLEDLELLTMIMWDGRLSIRTRCRSAATLVNLDVPAASEFLLLQYDLYRLERRSVSGWNLDPVRETLERLDSEQILNALDGRLTNERDVKMQNNIRTLQERMSLNRLPLVEVREIAGNPDWKTGMYRRYPAIEVLADRGGLEEMEFLKSLEPWQTDDEAYAQRVDGQNKVMLPKFIADAVAEIRRRHWETLAGSEVE